MALLETVSREAVRQVEIEQLLPFSHDGCRRRQLTLYRPAQPPVIFNRSKRYVTSANSGQLNSANLRPPQRTSSSPTGLSGNDLPILYSPAPSDLDRQTALNWFHFDLRPATIVMIDCLGMSVERAFSAMYLAASSSVFSICLSCTPLVQVRQLAGQGAAAWPVRLGMSVTFVMGSG
jgi:hypothetical protein